MKIKIKRIQLISALSITIWLACSAQSVAAPAVASADCTRGGAVDTACQDEKDDIYTGCCQTFGCAMGSIGESYCNGQGESHYNGCVILKGCPSLAD